MSGHVVAMAVTDGMPIFEFAVPCEVFGIDRSDLADPWYELRLCAAEPGELRTTMGLRVQPAYQLEDLVTADTLLIGPVVRPAERTPSAALVDAVRRAHARGVRIVSFCNGAYVLAAAGLLDGRRAAVHWMNASDLADRFPTVAVDSAVLFVDHGDVLTSAGTGAIIDLCLYLVRLDHGAAVANEVARRMVVPPHRDGGQAQFARPLPPGPVRSDQAAEELRALVPVLDWARANLALPLTVAELSRRAALSPRTFARRFQHLLGTSPVRWLIEQRVRAAQELLEATDEPVETIARRTGFGTAISLRQHFRRVVGVSPRAYRQMFRPPSRAGLRGR